LQETIDWYREYFAALSADQTAVDADERRPRAA